MEFGTSEWPKTLSQSTVMGVNILNGCHVSFPLVMYVGNCRSITIITDLWRLLSSIYGFVDSLPYGTIVYLHWSYKNQPFMDRFLKPQGMEPWWQPWVAKCSGLRQPSLGKMVRNPGVLSEVNAIHVMVPHFKVSCFDIFWLKCIVEHTWHTLSFPFFWSKETGDSTELRMK